MKWKSYRELVFQNKLGPNNADHVIEFKLSAFLLIDEVACALPEECEKICGTPTGCSNTAYPKLVMEILPTGLKGK